MHDLPRLALGLLGMLLFLGVGIWLGVLWTAYLEVKLPPGGFRTVSSVAPAVALPFVGIGGLVWFVLRPVHSAWRAFARGHGLVFRNSLLQGPRVTGTVEGVDLEFGTYNTHSSSRTAVTHTYLHASRANCTANEVAAALNTTAGRNAIQQGWGSLDHHDGALRLTDSDLLSDPEDMQDMMMSAIKFFEVVDRVKARRYSQAQGE